MLKKVDHIGILVRDLDQCLANYERLFGVKATRFATKEEPPLRIAFVPVGEGDTMLELVQPAVPGEGRLGKLLEEHGEGLNHVAYRVDNLDEALSELKNNGVKLLTEEPEVGASGLRIAFINPGETNSVLTELVEG